MRRALRLALLALLGPCLLGLGLCLHAALLPAPELLLPEPSLRLLDRSGQLLGAVRDANGDLVEPVRLGELSPWVIPSLLAAEDQRFYQHPGLDPIAMARAALQALKRGRVVSGASTLTQQLARTLFERPRSVAGKWRELALALRLEWSFDKSELLEAYLSRVDFGPRLRGIEAASRHYFDKPAAALSLAEAASLVAIVRGPTRYNPRRHPERLRQRRDQILARVRELGWAPRELALRARQAPLVLHEGYLIPGAFHFVRAAARGQLRPGPSAGELRSTLDGGLQRQVEAAVRGFGARFASHRASAAAVIVVENESGAVRAYLGSPDYASRDAQGQNDGVLALRQPGSTLKPFVYALALRDLGLHAASVLPDLEQRFISRDGAYVPHNFDRRFHGPVRLGTALAASLNVPAVSLAERLGPERIVSFLRSVGFEHLAEAGQYGPGIALGVAEVSLLQLAAAYAMLGRGGSYVDLAFYEGEASAPRRALPPAVVRQILSILADPRERAASFGRGGPLELDFPVAVKTGTSKGNRDNWVLGLTPELTVGVWVGNFDGSPMLRSSGATGAGPLFHAVMNAAARELTPRALGQGSWHPADAPGASESLEVCALSGQLAGPSCPHRLPERFWTGHVPRARCSWHRSACERSQRVDGQPELREPGPNDFADCPSLELLPARYTAWAEESGRALSPVVAAEPLPPTILSPRASARFALDSHLHPEQQQLVLSAQAASAARLVFEVDGHPVCQVGIPFKCPWRLRPGHHELRVTDEQGRSSRVTFTVQ